MRNVLRVMTLFFLILMVIRIVEMSMDFDWIDVLWTAIFLIVSLLFGAASQVKND